MSTSSSRARIRPVVSGCRSDRVTDVKHPSRSCGRENPAPVRSCSVRANPSRRCCAPRAASGAFPAHRLRHADTAGGALVDCANRRAWGDEPDRSRTASARRRSPAMRDAGDPRSFSSDRRAGGDARSRRRLRRLPSRCRQAFRPRRAAPAGARRPHSRALRGAGAGGAGSVSDALVWGEATEAA